MGRGVAVTVSGRGQVHQCNSCAYVCPHATIRPYALTAEGPLPSLTNARLVDVKAGKGKGVWYIMPCLLWTAWAAASASASACRPSPWFSGRDSELPEQEVFNLHGLQGQRERKGHAGQHRQEGSQFLKPLLEFSGSCAGCAETSHARLVTQLFGDRMYISTPPAVASIWGGPAATSPTP